MISVVSYTWRYLFESLGKKSASIGAKYITLVFLFCLPSGSGAQILSDSAIAVLEQIGHQFYAEAQRRLDFARGNKTLSDYDRAVLEILLQQSRILDYETYTLAEDDFRSTIESVKTVLKSEAVKQELSEAQKHFADVIIASASGLILLKTGRTLSAVKYGLAVSRALDELIGADSTNSLALIGNGVIKYYTGKWLPFGSGRSTRGIELLNRALNHRFPYNLAAANVRSWIAIDRQEYDTLNVLIDYMLELAPQHTGVLRLAFLAAAWQQQWHRTLDLTRKASHFARNKQPAVHAVITLAQRYAAEACIKLEKNNPRQCLCALEITPFGSTAADTVLSTESIQNSRSELQQLLQEHAIDLLLY